MRYRNLVLLTAACLSLIACGGGTRLVRKADVAPVSAPVLARADDGRLRARLDWVIVRNGVGAWARNADWDEYVITLENSAGGPLQITSITAVDSIGSVVAPEASRKQLVRSSKQTVRRYRASNLQVKAGMGGAKIAAAGAAVTAIGVGAAVSTTTASLMGGAGAAAGGAAAISAMLIAGPVFAVAGVVRAVRNGQVDDEIQQRRTALPLTLAGNGSQVVHVFFPLVPSPRSVEISYKDDMEARTLVIDVSEPLEGLHLPGEPSRK